MKPRLVLHIGTHKTGTTTIQRTLQSSRDALAERGILYPRTDREPWPELPKHCSVFSAAASGDGDRADHERQMLCNEIEGARAQLVVISEEGLSEPNPNLPAFFAPLAHRFEIEVICYLRRPDRFVESLYNQFVREGARREARPIMAFSRSRSLRERLDYHAVLSPWRDLPARVTAIDFDRVLQGPGLVASFARAAGLPDLGAEPESANRSPDMRIALVLARLNRARIDYQLAPLLRAARAIEEAGRFPPRRHLLGADERARLLTELAPSLDWLRADFGVAFDADLPPGEAAAAAEDLDAAYMAELLARVSKTA